MKDHQVALNTKIKARRVILIDNEGKKRGEFMRDDAIRIASEEGLDLVQVSPGEPPICKIMDFGKYQYEQKKKSRQGDDSKKNAASKMKEVKMSPVIDTNDFNIRASKAREFLEKGHKVKVTVVMHGRHRKFSDQAYAKAEELFEAVSDIAQVDSKPSLAGKYLTMILSRKSS